MDTMAPLAIVCLAVVLAPFALKQLLQLLAETDDLSWRETLVCGGLILVGEGLLFLGCLALGWAINPAYPDLPREVAAKSLLPLVPGFCLVVATVVTWKLTDWTSLGSFLFCVILVPFALLAIFVAGGVSSLAGFLGGLVVYAALHALLGQLALFPAAILGGLLMVWLFATWDWSRVAELIAVDGVAGESSSRSADVRATDVTNDRYVSTGNYSPSPTYSPSSSSGSNPGAASGPMIGNWNATTYGAAQTGREQGRNL